MQKMSLHGDWVQSGVLLVGGSNEGQGFLLICATTATALGTSLGIVQMQLCVTIVGFQDILHLFALMNLLVGTAKSRVTVHTHVRMRQSAACAADLGMLQRIALQKIASIHGFVTIVTGLATWQWIVRMRRLATIAASQDTWPRSAETAQFATLAIRRATLHATASLLSQAALFPHRPFSTLETVTNWAVLTESPWGHSFVKRAVVEGIQLGSAPPIL